MDAFLKRKNDEENSNDMKKAKPNETCPHAIKCYRRNPHHFKEYGHPHYELLQKGEPLELPPNYPQQKQIIMEQLEVLKSLRGLQKPAMEENKVKASTSTSSDGGRQSTRQKTTSYIPNSTPSSKMHNGPSMLEKLEKNAPYNLFFSIIPDSPQTVTHQNTITFHELLCPSLGDLKCSLQMNFMIDIAWLMEQYEKMGQEKKPLTILYGDEFPDMKKYIKLKLPNVTEQYVKPKDPFGIHHSKVGIYVYTDNSLRVVVSTANLYYEDWNYYNQGLWISPRCPVLDAAQSDVSGDGPTNFKTSLISYLNSYELPILKQWIDYIKRADFSAVRVHLVASVPGHHTAAIRPSNCHLHRVGELLSKHCSLPAKTTPTSEGPLSWGIIAQSSSIGNLGKAPGDWLRSTLLRSLASHKDCKLPSNSNATISVVYPTQNNVLGSYYGPLGGGCLPYSKSAHEKQKWLKDYLHEWRADDLSRSRAMPHIKTYCRVSPCTTKLAWYLITSANMSKAAWGANINKMGKSYVRSYEVGVLFIPSNFNETYFQIKLTDSDSQNLFPFVYDLPLTSYKKEDEPWCN
ncbi:probable tyrosyl-DNA phosphodiesterase isoform X2 [Photinus pyralis]|uniref:probable tyrosyl-DNA phosphodiesterase isoform X2 n=1 Tax=Photinus pyralis TaxID=7054 RepID=UPI0012674F11|nr:probable tyrosyl-DNA phosphodiesterase isoform X2 [Photinus pyralis]